MQEFELIQNAVFLQEKIRIAATERQWSVFEDNLSSMNAIESKLEALEKEREQLFTVYKALVREESFSHTLDSKGSFFALIEMLPESERNDLTSIYRSLKLEATKLRMANEALMTYLNTVKSTLKDFFDLAFPERGGNMYTKTGSHFSNDMRSMVLNKSF